MQQQQQQEQQQRRRHYSLQPDTAPRAIAITYTEQMGADFDGGRQASTSAPASPVYMEGDNAPGPANNGAAARLNSKPLTINLDLALVRRGFVGGGGAWGGWSALWWRCGACWVVAAHHIRRGWGLEGLAPQARVATRATRTPPLT